MPFVSHRALDLPPMKIDSSLGLRTIPDGTAYSLCKSLMCRQCGHLFVDYRFSETEMARLYADYRGATYTELRDRYEPGYAQRNLAIREGIDYLPEIENFLDGLVPDSEISVLDWGGDTGVNTPFKDRRSLLHIFDPSANEAGEPGAESFSEIPAGCTAYDLIVLSNVLEHIPFPADTLHAILPFMTSKTTLYVEVPFEGLRRQLGDSPYSGADKKKHWHEHINFFTPESMKTLLERSGLTVVAESILDLGDSQANIGLDVKLLQYACRPATR